MTPVSPESLADALDRALPQTQCTRCGYPDCRSYAVAIAEEQAPINRCPPGGQEGVARLARISGRAEEPLNPANGIEAPRVLALIDEAWCIGCTLCLKACPVDCIIGGPKLMHTVVANQCTGCELCLPACPVDCISLVPASEGRTGWGAWTPAQADAARDRYAFHRVRLEQDRIAEEALRATAAGSLAPADASTEPTGPPAKAATIQAVLARARASRQV